MKTIRGGAILYKDNMVALLACERNGETFYTFPGGRMEKRDGTVEETMIREVREETGLRVEATHLLATFENDWSMHHYFGVNVLGGRFGKGHGPEFNSWEARYGKIHFEAVWMPISELLNRDVRPRKLAQVIPDLIRGGLDVPLVLTEKKEEAVS